MGKDAIIGVTANSPEEAETAAQGGADYLGLGTVFATPTYVPIFFSPPKGTSNISPLTHTQQQREQQKHHRRPRRPIHPGQSSQVLPLDQNRLHRRHQREKLPTRPLPIQNSLQIPRRHSHRLRDHGLP